MVPVFECTHVYYEEEGKKEEPPERERNREEKRKRQRKRTPMGREREKREWTDTGLPGRKEISTDANWKLIGSSDSGGTGSCTHKLGLG